MNALQPLKKQATTRRRQPRLKNLIFSASAILSITNSVDGFISKATHPKTLPLPLSPELKSAPYAPGQSRKHTSLNVWWFGGSNSEETSFEDECELVAVRIERTSPNSRRISGEIIVPKPVDDVWAVLTDYDNLAIHVPNLVESSQVNPSGGKQFGNSSFPGDGQYECRLYQKGAQKIVGFEFGASVTMDMSESIMNDHRLIRFKCVESQFFSEFDGEWKVSPTVDPENPEETCSKLQYIVDVRPRGPVPVTALEWRIREDVPTNLRAVKAASIELGLEGVLKLNDSLRSRRNGRVSSPSSWRRGRVSEVAARSRKNVSRLVNQAATVSSSAVANATAPKPKPMLAPVMVDWYEDETMAAYLKKKSY